MRRRSLAAKPLSEWEAKILARIEEAAEKGEPAPLAEDLAEICGCSAISTTVRLVHRLDQRGLIKVEVYQRGRRITVVATGKSTAPVRNQAPHWRVRPRPASMPAPSLAHVKGRNLNFALEVMQAARADGMEFADFLAELAWHGWQVREAAIQARAAEG